MPVRIYCLFLLLFAVYHAATAQPAGNTVFIGNQEWMAQNLNVDRYADGTKIPEAKTIAEWQAYNDNKSGCYCNYDNEAAYAGMYGKLYNWYAVKRGVVPHCWRLPARADFDRLVAHMKEEHAGKKLKAKNSWSNDWNGDNASGFAGFAAGCRNPRGTFSFVGRQAFWWTADARKMNNKETGLFFSVNFDDKCSYDASEDFGFSVRCVRDARSLPPQPCP